MWSWLAVPELFFRAAWSYMTCERTALRTRSSRNWLGSVELSQRRPGWAGGGRGLRFLLRGGFLSPWWLWLWSWSASGLPAGVVVSGGARAASQQHDILEERATATAWAGGRARSESSASMFAAEPLPSL